MAGSKKAATRRFQCNLTIENIELLHAECARIRKEEGCAVFPGRVVNRLISEGLNGNKLKRKLEQVRTA